MDKPKLKSTPQVAAMRARNRDAGIKRRDISCTDAQWALIREAVAKIKAEAK